MSGDQVRIDCFTCSCPVNVRRARSKCGKKAGAMINGRSFGPKYLLKVACNLRFACSARLPMGPSQVENLRSRILLQILPPLLWIIAHGSLYCESAIGLIVTSVETKKGHSIAGFIYQCGILADESKSATQDCLKTLRPAFIFHQ